MISAIFELLCQEHGLPDPVAEFRFAPPRRWKFDWCWPERKVAVEIEGGVWSKGRHVRGKGFLGDLEKYNVACVLGWRLLRFTPQQVQSGEAFRTIQAALRAEGIAP